MDIGEIEMAARLVFAMVKKHPEICPHYYEHSHTHDNEDDGKLVSRKEYYKCIYCGDVHMEEKFY